MMNDDNSDTALNLSERKLLIGNWVAFVLTLGLNGLGSTGAISGHNIGDISDTYNTKFTPASSAFSIWGLIYGGLALYWILVTLPFGLRKSESRYTTYEQMGPWFMISCACNSCWILLFMWQTPVTTWLSSPLLFGLLASLLVIADRCRFWLTPRANWLETICLDGIFSIYMGWATVASIVNVAAALVSSGWRGAPWTETGWTVLLLCIAAIINILVIIRKNNSVAAFVFTWAAAWIAVAQSADAIVCNTAIALAVVVAVAGLANIARNVLANGSCVRVVEDEQGAAAL